MKVVLLTELHEDVDLRLQEVVDLASPLGREVLRGLVVWLMRLVDLVEGVRVRREHILPASAAHLSFYAHSLILIILFIY